MEMSATACSFAEKGDGGSPRGDEWSYSPLPPPTSLHPFAADHLLFGHREGGLGFEFCVCVSVCVF